VPTAEDDIYDPSIQNKREYKNLYQDIYETRIAYLIRLPLLLYDNLNAGDLFALNQLINESFLPHVEIETLGPTTIKSGRQNVFNYFLTLLDVAPDLFVTTDCKPVLLNDRIIALNIHVRGTKIDYTCKYLDTHLKYYMDQMSSNSSTAVNLVPETNSTVKFTSGHNKRTYREFITHKKHIRFHLHFSIHLVLNPGLTHVVKFIKMLKSVQLSMPSKSCI
jgi:hypothetical protein